MPEDKTTALLEMTTGIIANYVAHNRVTPDALPGLIASVHRSLSGAGNPAAGSQDEAPDRLTPAQIKKLVTAAGIKNLIDGRTFKSLRRHVTTHGYTPETYREHFGLPRDFPMVSPDYAAARSALARASGLGQKKAAAKPARKPGAKS